MDFLFLKNKRVSRTKLSRLKVGLLPIFITNWIVGLSVLEYPFLGKQRIVITIIFQALLWCIFGYLFHLAMKEYYVNIKSELSRFQLQVLFSYYTINNFSFFICVLVCLYNSEVNTIFINLQVACLIAFYCKF